MSSRDGEGYIRDRVLAALIEAGAPQTSDEIIKLLISRSARRVYAASVYRSLRDLQKAGRVVKDPLLRTYVASLNRG